MTTWTVQDIMTLPYVRLRDWKKIQTTAGVYCVISRRDEVIYVGLTKRSVRARLQSHHRRQKFLRFGDVTVAVIQDGDLDAIERDMIRVLAPRLNTHGISLDELTERHLNARLVGLRARLSLPIDSFYEAYAGGCEALA